MFDEQAKISLLQQTYDILFANLFRHWLFHCAPPSHKNMEGANFIASAPRRREPSLRDCSHCV